MNPSAEESTRERDYSRWPMKRLLASGLNWRSLLARNPVVRNTLYSFIGFGVPFFVTLLATPLLVNRMGKEGYGLWKVAISVLGMMGVLEFGLGTTIAKYIAEYTSRNDIEGLSAVVTIGFLLNAIGGLLLTLPLYFLAPKIAPLFSAKSVSLEQVEGAIRVISFGFVPFLLRSSGLAVPRGLERFGILTLIQAIQSILTTSVALLVSLSSDSLQFVVIGTVVVIWMIGLTSLGIAFRMLRSWNIRFNFSFTKLRQMLAFMVFTGSAGFGRQIFNSLDQIAVGAVLGLSEVAYYAVAIGIAKKFIGLCGALTQALMPAASSWCAAGNIRKIWRYFGTSTGLLIVFNSVMAGGLLVSSGPFLRLWMGEDFARTALVPYRVLIVVYAVMSITAPASQVATGIGVPWIVTFGAIVGGIATILSIIVLGRTFGLVGAAWANAASWIKLSMPVYVRCILLKRLKGSKVGQKRG